MNVEGAANVINVAYVCVWFLMTIRPVRDAFTIHPKELVLSARNLMTHPRIPVEEYTDDEPYIYEYGDERQGTDVKIAIWDSFAPLTFLSKSKPAEG